MKFLVTVLVLMLVFTSFAFAQTPFGTPPGRSAQTRILMLPHQPINTRSFIVIPIFRASPETIAYAIQADDIIYDMGVGSGQTQGRNVDQGNNQRGNTQRGTQQNNQRNTNQRTTQI